MSKKRVKYFQVCLTEALGGIKISELESREHFDSTRMGHQQLLPAVNRMRNTQGFGSCGVSNVIGDGFEALVLFDGTSLSIRDQLRAEKMCEDMMG